MNQSCFPWVIGHEESKPRPAGQPEEIRRQKHQRRDQSCQIIGQINIQPHQEDGRGEQDIKGIERVTNKHRSPVKTRLRNEVFSAVGAMGVHIVEMTTVGILGNEKVALMATRAFIKQNAV